MFEGTTRKEAWQKLGAILLGIAVIVILVSASVHGYSTGRNLITSTLGLLFALGLAGLLIFVIYRWAHPTRNG